MSRPHRKPTASAKKVAKIAFTGAGSQRADHGGSGGRSAGARAGCPLSAMPVKAQYIVRAGALAFALGVGGVVATTPGVAFAAPNDTNSSRSSSDSSSASAQASSTSSPSDDSTNEKDQTTNEKDQTTNEKDQKDQTTNEKDQTTNEKGEGSDDEREGSDDEREGSDDGREAADPPAAKLPTQQSTAAPKLAAPAPSAEPEPEPEPSPDVREVATPETPVATAAAPKTDAPRHESHTAPNSAGSDRTNLSGSAS